MESSSRKVDMKIIQYDWTGEVSLAILKPGENPQMIQGGCPLNEEVHTLTLYVKVTDFYNNEPYYSIIPIHNLQEFTQALTEGTNMSDAFNNAQRIIQSYLGAVTYDPICGPRNYVISLYNHPANGEIIPVEFITEVLDKFIQNYENMEISRAKVATLKDYL